MIVVPDADGVGVFVVTAYDLGGKPLAARFAGVNESADDEDESKNKNEDEAAAQ